jgi:hypothetical protein
VAKTCMIATPAITTSPELDLRDEAIERARVIVTLMHGYQRFLPSEIRAGFQQELCNFWAAYWLQEVMTPRDVSVTRRVALDILLNAPALAG